MMLKKSKSVLYAALFFSGLQNLYAQVEVDEKMVRDRFNKARYVYLNRDKNIQILLKDGVPVVSTENVTRGIVLDEHSLGYNEQSIPYKVGYHEIEEVEAATYVKKGNSYEKLKVKDIKDEDQLSNDIFYDGVRQKKVLFPGVGQGAVTELKYKQKVLDPHFMGSFQFKSYSPTMNSKLSVTFPKDVNIGWKMKGDSSSIKFSKVQKGNRWVYTWEASNLPEVSHLSDEASFYKYEPHIFVYIKDYNDGKNNVKLIGGTKELYKFEYTYLRDINKLPFDPRLSTVIDSLKKISPTQDALISNVFYWVQDNIRYIAFENGIGGFQPRDANDVFAKKYGDCKDLANIITYMLKKVDIPAYLSWIGTRSLPYTYEGLPLTYASNHMIAAVQRGKEWVFLDGTAKNCPYKLPTGFIQGKEAMISISPDSFVVARVPVVPPSQNIDKDSITLTLDGKTLKGKGSLEYRGMARANLLDHLHFVGTNDKDKQIKNFLNAGNNKCNVESYTIKNQAFRDSTLKINYSFSVPDYVREIESDIYINLNLRKKYTSMSLDTVGRKKYDKEFPYCMNDSSTTVLNIPQGYVVKKMPQGFNVKTAAYTYNCQYIQVGHSKIVFKEHFQMNDLVIENKDFDSWNAFSDKLTAQNKQLIVLSKK